MQNSISKFLGEVEHYQSNHYGFYNRVALVNAYHNLPIGLKNYLTPDSKRIDRLWRGCDGLSETRAISFTTNKGVAHLFGAYVIPFGELKKYNGAIDTEKSQRLNHKLGYEFSIGDDEGEVIVVNPVWNQNLESNIRKYLVS